tara:strand:+ start:3501 stop:3869 length:369 start_codon:yes stop_codon:yes gene_type:complete
MFLTFLVVGLGGFLGAITRFMANNAVANQLPSKPYMSTVLVNIIGSILLGFFYYVSSQLDLKPNIKEFFVVGYLGSLTTFSTFSFEFNNLINDKNFIKAFTYLSLNLVLGFLSIYFFIRLIK